MKWIIALLIIGTMLYSSSYAQFESLKNKFKQKTEEAIENSMEEEENEENVEEENEAEKTKEKKSFKTYSKFDFVAGEKLLFYDDFSTTQMADFPANWDTDVSAEVVKIDGIDGNWFHIAANGFFKPDYDKKLPENFTVEYDIIFTGDWVPNITIYFYKKIEGEMINEYLVGSWGLWFDICGYGYAMKNYKDQEYSSIASDMNTEYLMENRERVVNIRMWFQGKRVRVYVDEKKVFDLPRAVISNDMDAFRFQASNFDEDRFNVYISNIRVAESLPDMRKRLDTQGKIISYGIKFDSGSDEIKDESYAAIKEIAELLKAENGLKLKITGHTDSDGDENTNMSLSLKRANAVKAMLVKEFSIDESRLSCDGKGESEPLDKNETPESKAKNRRVEFTKM